MRASAGVEPRGPYALSPQARSFSLQKGGGSSDPISVDFYAIPVRR